MFEVGPVRLRASFMFPYFNQAYWSLRFVPVKGLGTMGVDKYWRCYYDPDVKWTVEQGVYVLTHEIGHLLREHHDRAEQIPGVNNKAWNLAGDAEINDDLDEIPELKKHTPFKVIMPKDLECDNGDLAEMYYSHIMKNAKPGKCGCGQDGSGSAADGDSCDVHNPTGIDHKDCGSGAGGEKREWEQGEPSSSNPGTNKVQGDIVRQGVARDIIEHSSKSRGSVPGGWARWADALLNPKIDWRKVIPQLIRAASAVASGMVDYSYRRPSRRTQPGGVILPVMRRPVVPIGVVVDTSGSMGKKEITRNLTEIGGMLKSFPDVTVYSCDADVHNATKVTGDVAKIELLGGGGTDMARGIEHVARQGHKVIVVLTDGYTGWPEMEPAVPTIIAILNNPKAETPSWATTVFVNDD